MMDTTKQLERVEKSKGRELTPEEISRVEGFVSRCNNLELLKTAHDCMEKYHDAADATTDSYKSKANLKMTFLQAMIEAQNVDVTLIEEAFNEALAKYRETTEED